jgi:hypothetical protein
MENHVLSYSDWTRIQETDSYLGAEVLNENVSDTLHFITDLVAIGSDLVAPGSGAVVDIVNAISYFIESQYLDEDVEKSIAIVAGLVTLGSVALMGPLESLAIEAKVLLAKIREGVVKTATPVAISIARSAAKKLIPLLTNISKTAVSIGDTIVNLVVKAADSRVGKWVSSKFGGMDKFVAWAKDFFKVKVPKFLAYMISLLVSLNPTAAAAGSVDDISIKKFGKETAKTQATDGVIKKITDSGKKEILASGIPPSDKYKKFQSQEQEFQRDTTSDMKPVIVRPLPIKRNA